MEWCSLAHPSWGCVKLSDFLKLQGISVSSPTVQKILIRNEMVSVYDRWLKVEDRHLETGTELTAEQVEKIEKINPCFRERHVESSRPGELLCQDTILVRNRNDYFYLIDTKTSNLTTQPSQNPKNI